MAVHHKPQLSPYDVNHVYNDKWCNLLVAIALAPIKLELYCHFDARLISSAEEMKTTTFFFLFFSSVRMVLEMRNGPKF
jgi:hypothetical protein